MLLKLAIPEERLLALVTTQLQNNFLLELGESKLIESCLARVLNRIEVCFAENSNKYYRREGIPFFNPYHSGQYCVFLYFLAHTIHKLHPGVSLCDKLYFLNKMLNAIDLFYEVEMPDVFFIDHPVGTVLGRASYGKGFSFSQNCTVGNNRGLYPIIGENVTMFAGAMILGKSNIGENSLIAARTLVKDQNVPPGSVVFGISPNLVLKSRSDLPTE